MTFHNGDTIVTEDHWGEVLIAGSTDLIGPGSEVEIGLLGPPNQIREGTVDLTTGERPDTWNDIDHQVAVKLQEFQKAGHLLPVNTSLVDYDTVTLEAAYKRISDIPDPCRAA